MSTIRSIALTLAACSAVGSTASAQGPLFSNQGVDASTPALSTGPTAANGAAAPASSTWSECPREGAPGSEIAGAIAGLASGVAADGSYRLADNFTVPTPGGWLVSSIAFYAYQPGATASLSPFASMNLRIWKGQPGLPGSQLVFGDTTTNRLTGAAPLPIFRIFSSLQAPLPIAPDTSKLLWQTSASTTTAGRALLLKPGVYWVDWQHGPTASGLSIFTPPTTKPGVGRTTLGANALQFRPNTAGVPAWLPAIDPGKPSFASDAALELPFVISGTPHCAADVDDGTGTGTPDLGVGIEDLLYYLLMFEIGGVDADLDDGSGLGNPDNGVGIEDLLFFLSSFEQGC